MLVVLVSGHQAQAHVERMEDSGRGGTVPAGSRPPLIPSGCGMGCTPPSAEDVAALLRRMAHAGLAGRMPAVLSVQFDAQSLGDACEPTRVGSTDTEDNDSEEDEDEAGMVMRLRRLGVTATDGSGVGAPVGQAEGSQDDIPAGKAWRSRLQAWLGDFCAAAVVQAASSRSSSPGDAAAEAAEAEAEAAAEALVARLHRIVDFTDLVHEDLQDCPRTEDEAALSRRVRVLCPGAAASATARPECDTASDTEVAVAAVSDDMLSEAVAAGSGAASSECDQVAWLAELDLDHIKAIALREGLGSGTPIHESMLAKTITPIISLLDAVGVEPRRARGRWRSNARGGRRKRAARQQSEQTSEYSTAQTAGGHDVTRGLFGDLHAQPRVKWRQAPVLPPQSQWAVDSGGAWSAKKSFANIKWRHARTDPPDVAMPSEHKTTVTQAKAQPFAWIPGAPDDAKFRF